MPNSTPANSERASIESRGIRRGFALLVILLVVMGVVGGILLAPYPPGEGPSVRELHSKWWRSIPLLGGLSALLGALLASSTPRWAEARLKGLLFGAITLGLLGTLASTVAVYGTLGLISLSLWLDNGTGKIGLVTTSGVVGASIGFVIACLVWHARNCFRRPHNK
jgi:hypothetical protein